MKKGLQVELWSHQINVPHHCLLIPPVCIGVCVCLIPACVFVYVLECVSMHPVTTGNERMIACFLLSSEADLTDYKHCSLVHGTHAWTHARMHTHHFLYD